jgi:hypothetical protein
VELADLGTQIPDRRTGSECNSRLCYAEAFRGVYGPQLCDMVLEAYQDREGHCGKTMKNIM